MKQLAGVLVAAVIAACGGGDDADSPDAPPADDPDAALDAAPIERDGIVIVSEQIQGDGSTTNVQVTMSEGALFGGANATAGDCAFYPQADDTGVSAGVITVTGTTAPITATPGGAPPAVSYDAGELPDDLFEDGATLTITAAGADVPAFTGSVVAPAALAGVALPTEVSRAAPPTITWTAGAADEMWIWMLGLGGGGHPRLLWCRVPDSGSYAVPADAVALLPTAVTQGIVVLWRTGATPVTAGAWTVELVATHAVGTQLIQFVD